MNLPLFKFTAVGILTVFVASDCVLAQQSGSRGGVSAAAYPQALPELSPQVAQSFLTVDGSAVVRVKPTQIRVVLAVTTEAPKASECKRMMAQKMQQLRTAWTGARLRKEDVVEDFISVLPQYEFDVKKVEGSTVAIEKKSGYLMQTNVHLAVESDEAAMRAIDAAFENEVTDIIAFDYWSKELDAKKKEARELAVQAAKDKAETLLGALFEKVPPVINVREKTTVHYPDSMYQSFENSSSAQYNSSYALRRDIPRMLVARPKNTYYRGHVSNADVGPSELQMRAEISVESKVQVYFESPVAKSFNAGREE